MMQQETSIVGSGSAPVVHGLDKLLERGAGETGSEGARVAAFSIQDLAQAVNWRWLNEEQCRSWVLKRLYPLGPQCPVCGAVVREGKVTESWWQLRRVRCHMCSSYYRATKGTILQHCGLEIRQIVMLAWAFNLGLSNSMAATVAGANCATARFWRLRLEAVANSSADINIIEELIDEKL